MTDKHTGKKYEALIREANMQHKTTAEEMYAMQVEEELLATNRKEFWDGFWGVFRHPVTIYCFGFTAGAVTCELLKLAR